MQPHNTPSHVIPWTSDVDIRAISLPAFKKLIEITVIHGRFDKWSDIAQLSFNEIIDRGHSDRLDVLLQAIHELTVAIATAEEQIKDDCTCILSTGRFNVFVAYLVICDFMSQRPRSAFALLNCGNYTDAFESILDHCRLMLGSYDQATDWLDWLRSEWRRPDAKKPARCGSTGRAFP